MWKEMVDNITTKVSPYWLPHWSMGVAPTGITPPLALIVATWWY